MLRNPDYEEYLARRERLGIITPKPFVRLPVTSEQRDEPTEEDTKSYRDFMWVSGYRPSEALPNLPKPHEAEIRVQAEGWKRILREVSSSSLIHVRDILGKSRSKPIVAARQETCYRMVTELNMSYPAVGRRMGLDHSTVLHSVRKHAEKTGLYTPRGRDKSNKEHELRNAEIVRCVILGDTPEDLAFRHELSVDRIKQIIWERARGLAKVAVERIAKEAAE